MPPEAEGRASLEGKTVAVTGAGRGIGRATALHLAARGARLVINDLEPALLDSLARDIVLAGGQAACVPGSVADWATAAQLTEAAVARFGRLDGLFNNAGLHYQAMPWDETEAQVRATVEVNFLGSLYCGIHALKAFAVQGSGSLVNVTSAAHLGVDARGVYAATKGATASLTYGWARDMAGRGVRVNAVAPLAATRMTDASLEEGDPGGAGTQVFEGLQAPDALAPLVAFLLGDASIGVTGRILRFTGSDLSVIQPPRVEAPTCRQDWDDALFAAALASQDGAG